MRDTSTRPEWTTPDDFDGPEDYGHAVDEWELSHRTCAAHYPLILDGHRLYCELDADHAGNHECETPDDTWSGSRYEWVDQAECWI